MADPTTSFPTNVFDIVGAKAVVEWSQPDGQAAYLSTGAVESSGAGSLTFDCHFHPSSSSASFRLRVPILLKGLGRKATPLYVFVAPERIQSIAHNGADPLDVPDDARKTLGDGGLVSLRFILRQPVDLVAPPQNPLLPKKKIHWDILDSLKTLAKETSFTVYLKQEEKSLENWMPSLCDAISAGGLSSSATHGDITRLYDGKGGKVLTREDPSIPANLAEESPPSYEDSGPPPPAPPKDKATVSSGQGDAASSSRKRPRTSSSEDDNSTPPFASAQMEAVCRKLMGEMTAKWREESDQLRSELRSMETRIQTWVDERLDRHVAEIREEMRRTSVRQQNQTHEQVQEVKLEVQEVRDEAQVIDERSEEIAEDVQKLKDETSDLVDSRLDERLEGLQSELEEYVAEHLHDAEDRVIDRLRSNVYIDFGIYD